MTLYFWPSTVMTTSVAVGAPVNSVRAETAQSSLVLTHTPSEHLLYPDLQSTVPEKYQSLTLSIEK